ncbi:hypothetical protein MCEZE10_01919 [Sphingomonadaceae bacterium]|jgi:hypothetical protein
MTALCADAVRMLLVGNTHQILPIYGEVATRGVDGGGWRLTRGDMCVFTSPSTTPRMVPLPVNGED